MDEEVGSDSEGDVDGMRDIKQHLETEGKSVQMEEPLESTYDNGALRKTILVRGQGWESPKPGAEVVINYVGRRQSDGEVDSKQEAFRFTLGTPGSVRSGWHRALATMKKGEKAKFVFEEREKPEDVEYEIELLSWAVEESVTVDGEVLKVVLKAGTGEDTPGALSLCYVSYFLKSSEGKCIIGSEDTSRVDSITLDLSSADVLEGIVIVLKTMKTGERARVKIGSGYAFGMRGNNALSVGSGEDLEGEVELLDFMESPKLSAMTVVEKLAHGNKLKELGNMHLKNDSARRARCFYEEAGEVFKSRQEGEHQLQIDQLITQSKSNLAMCTLKQRDYPLTVSVCSEALLIDPHNIKLLFRRAQALQHLKEHAEALRDLAHIVQQEGKTSNVVAKLIKEIKQAKVQEQRAQAKIFGGMFDRLSLVSDEELPPEARQIAQKSTWKACSEKKPFIFVAVLVSALAVLGYGFT